MRKGRPGQLCCAAAPWKRMRGALGKENAFPQPHRTPARTGGVYPLRTRLRGARCRSATRSPTMEGRLACPTAPQTHLVIARCGGAVTLIAAATKSDFFPAPSARGSHAAHAPLTRLPQRGFCGLETAVAFARRGVMYLRHECGPSCRTPTPTILGSSSLLPARLRCPTRPVQGPAGMPTPRILSERPPRRRAGPDGRPAGAPAPVRRNEVPA
jgi:hypothetical protein